MIRTAWRGRSGWWATVSLQGGFCSCPPGPKIFHLQQETQIPASTSTQSSTTCTGWRSGSLTFAANCCKFHFAQVMKYRQSAASWPLGQKGVKICCVLTGRSPRSQKKTLEFNTVLGFCPPSAVWVLWLSIMHWFIFLFFYFFKFKREVKRKGTHLPPGSHMWLKIRLEWMIAIRIAWRHCPLTLCCLPGGLPWTSATSATQSKAQTSAAAQGKTAHLIGRAFES